MNPADRSSIVLDASVAASWCLPNEQSKISERVFQSLPHLEIYVPWIWWFEIHNIFIINERRKRFSSVETEQALQGLLALKIIIDDQPNAMTILTLARKHNLTFYDAAYLELALRKFIPLATFDAAIIHAAEKQGVPVNP